MMGEVLKRVEEVATTLESSMFGPVATSVLDRLGGLIFGFVAV